MNERQYREHWATLTGRPAREVYVPLALRDPEPVEPPLDAVQEMLDRLGGPQGLAALVDDFRFGEEEQG